MFNWWLDQPCYPWKGVPARKATWVWEEATPELSLHRFDLAPREVIQHWYRDRLRFKPAVVTWADKLAKKYKVDFDRTVGVSWRGCDNVVDGRRRVAVEDYFPTLDHILKDGGLRILSMPEEATVTERLQQRYPQVFAMGEFFTAPWGYDGQSFALNQAPGYSKGFETCAMILLLSRCRHYVHNEANLSVIVGNLSRGNVVQVK